MADSVRASTEGLEIVDRARRKKGWTKTVTSEWLRKANTTQATLKRFWRRQRIDRYAFKGICSAVDVNWEEIVEWSEVQEAEPLATATSASPSQPDPNFVGRDSAIAELNTLVSQGKKVILIQAEGGVGKTTLAYRYLKMQGFDMVLELWMAKERQNITSVESVIEEWLKRYFDEEPGREFGVSLERLRCKLGDGSKKIGVLIDNLEPTLENGRFIEEHRRYAELLRMLANPTVQSVTLITSRERLYEDGISVWLYPLRELPKEAWNQFFETCGINTGSCALSDASALYQMHQAYGGNAEAMFVLSGAIQIECQGDLEAYWEENHEDLLINPTLENLVKSQFNKLQQDDEQAYRLLCRLGCYRYQDVPSVPKEGIFYLLWDVPEERRKRVVKALRDRSLVKVCNEEYYLHPVIRAEAVDRLRASEDWETANRTAAEFWTGSVERVETIEDALRAFEAYYHYVEINDFELAAEVLINERENKWAKVSPLGVSFYRLGFLKQIIYSLNRLINKIKFGYPLSRIYNILGDSYWMAGQIERAINCHKKSRIIASDCQKSILPISDMDKLKLKLRRCEIAALLNIGLCKIDLWELEEAVNLFQEVSSLPETNDYLSEPILNCWFCLAFLYSSLGLKQRAKYFAEKSELLLNFIDKPQTEWATGNRLFFLAITYKNLENNTKSFKLYHRAIAYAEESQYPQVRAKALYGLAELYRKEGDFETAVSHHSEAIELLDKIGAKCDLAEAYYQLGLTYQKIGEVENSQENFDKAIRLFNEMEAPKQVEKVRKAIKIEG